MIKKAIILLLALTAVICVFSGCRGDVRGPSDSESADTSTPVKEEAVSMYDLRKAMCSADDSLPEMLYASSSDSDPDVLFANVSDVEYDKVESFFLAYAADGKAYEIAVVCAKDEANAGEITASLTKHAAQRAKTYSYYMPDQTAKAEEAEVFTSGKYSVLIMCDNKEAVKKAFFDMTSN